MKTARRLTTAAMFFTALAFATRIQAQADSAATVDPVLKAIPDDALAFAMINDLAKTDSSISKLATLVQAPAPSGLSMLKSMAGIQEGFDENGSAAIALMPDKSAEGAKPFPVIYLPVTDYKKFIAAFKPDDATAETTGVTIANQAMVVGHKDSFAAFTVPDHKAQLAKVIASTKGVDTIVGSFKPWIGKHQISIVGTPTGSKTALQAASEGLKTVRAIIAAQPNAQQTAQVTAAFDMYQSVLAKASTEVDSFGFGLGLDENSNLSIDSHTTLIAGGAWDTATKGLKAAEGNRFAGVQAAPFVFAFEGIWPEQWGDAMADLTASMTASMTKASGGEGMDEQQQKNYADAMRSLMKGLHGMSFVMGTPKPGGSMYDGMAASMKVDDASSFLTNYRKSMDQVIDATKDLKNFPFKFSDVKKIEIDGHSGLAISMDMSGMLANGDPATAKLMQTMFGPTGKLTTRLLVADDHTLVVAYGSEDHAKEVLAAYKNPQSSLASDPDVATTLKLLPPHAQWVGLVSIKGYMDLIRSVLAGAIPAGGPAINLPELPAMPPIGFTAEAGTTGLDTQMILPAETLGTISKVSRHAIQQQGAPGGTIPPGQ